MKELILHFVVLSNSYPRLRREQRVFKPPYSKGKETIARAQTNTPFCKRPLQR